MNIILTGFMGTGKTSVGKRLAKRMGWQFIDVDRLIEASAKRSIPELFAQRGEAVFRRLERRCISRIIHDRYQVIATGGGAFVDPHSRARLRLSGPVICLTATPQTVLARVGRKIATRPLLAKGHDPLARIRTLLRQRAPAYAKADLSIDTSHLAIEDVVERLWKELAPYLCRSWQYVQEHATELAHRYCGQYIVVVDDQIVATGPTQLEAYHNAPHRLTEKRDAGIYYIPLPEESLTAL